MRPANQRSKAAKVPKVSKPECPICLELFHDPVTTRCGHTFCFHCLFLANIRECPMCRQGPLLVELGDFEPDSLMEMRVRVENSCVLPNPFAKIGAGGKGRTNRGAQGNHQIPVSDESAKVARRQHLLPVLQLLASYKAQMEIWSSTYEQTSRQPSPEYIAETMRVRLQLGRSLLSHYTYDENQQHHMFYEGGFMWRRAPSLAVQRRSSEVDGDGEGNNSSEDVNRQVQGEPPKVAPRQRVPLPLAQRTPQGPTSHIDHLLQLEAEKRHQTTEKRAESNRCQLAPPRPPQIPTASAPLHCQPLKPIMITPRGKVWATPVGGNGFSLAVVDVNRHQRQRPQSAAEQMEDVELALATRAFLKQSGRTRA